MLPAVTATRYVTPLREGGSLPGLMEADDLGTYVVKWRAAGQGVKVLVAEVVCGELARALGPAGARAGDRRRRPGAGGGGARRRGAGAAAALGRPQPRAGLPARRAGLRGRCRRRRPRARRPGAVVRRAGRQRRPVLAQPEHAVLARPAAADRPRRRADLPPPLARRRGGRRPRPTTRRRTRCIECEPRRAGRRRRPGAAGDPRRCSRSVLAQVPDEWLEDDADRPRRRGRATSTSCWPGWPPATRGCRGWSPRPRPAGAGAAARRGARTGRPGWVRRRRRGSPSDEDRTTFEYAVLRVVPRVERGEALNAGVLVYCRQRDYLGSRVHLDVDRLRALDPTADADGDRPGAAGGGRRLRRRPGAGAAGRRGARARGSAG